MRLVERVLDRITRILKKHTIDRYTEVVTDCDGLLPLDSIIGAADRASRTYFGSVRVEYPQGQEPYNRNTILKKIYGRGTTLSCGREWDILETQSNGAYTQRIFQAYGQVQ